MRARIAVIVMVGAVLCLPLSAGSERAPIAPPPRPNVLIIVTDDQRAGEGTLGVMDRTRQWLMTGGTRFTQAFSTTPLCCPARASIFSGRYAHNHRVWSNSDGPNFDHRFSIQDYLDDAGYQTGIIGKLFNTWGLRRRPPHFDKWSIFDGGYSNAKYNVNGRVRTVADYSTNFLAEKSVDFLKNFEGSDDAPWFLYVAPYAPHAPFVPGQRYLSSKVPYWNGNPAVFEYNRKDKPAYVRMRHQGYKKWRKNRRAQLRSLMSVDDLVGRVRRTIFDLDESRDTLIFYLSDNGYMWADHGLYDKGAPYTPSIRVPFLLRYPAGPTLPAVDRRLVANIDIAPTILDAVGIPQRPGHRMDGTSLFANPWDRDRILAEYKNADNPYTPPTWATTRTDEYQYTEYYDNGKRIFREYYDIDEDPWQLHNPLGDGKKANNPQGISLKKLSNRLRRDRNCAGSKCP